MSLTTLCFICWQTYFTFLFYEIGSRYTCSIQSCKAASCAVLKASLFVLQVSKEHIAQGVIDRSELDT